METSDKENRGDWVGQTQRTNQQHESGTPATTVTEPPFIQPEPYSEDDTFRSERIDQIIGENEDISVYIQDDEFGKIDAATAKTLLSNAREREKWDETLATQYGGLLQLATIRTPPRKNRVL